MKFKELYDYVREQVINELTTVTKDTQSSEIDSIAKAEKVEPSTVSRAINKAKTTRKDVDIAEMARKAGSYSKGSKFDEAKEIYTQGLVSYVLKAIEELGENATPANIAAKIQEYEPGSKVGDVGTVLRNFKAVNILSGGPLAAAPKPEKKTKEEPESEEPESEEPVDTWEKPEEEETPEEEPETVSDKEVEKTVGKTYAELSPEEEDMFNKFKQAIINKVKILTDKKASKEDKAKAQAAIDNYKSKADLKKVFTKKGLNLIDFINGELKK